MAGEIITGLEISKNILSIIPNDIKKSILTALKLTWNQGKTEKIFEEYLDSKYQLLSKMKTLLHSNPIPISEFYIQSPIKYNNNYINESQLIKFILSNKNIIVSGIAGLGKSVLLKSLFLNIASNNYNIFPIFIELRDLNYSNESMLDYISKSISNTQGNITKENLEKLIKKGRFILIIDGFDELNFNLREKYTDEIIKLSEKHRNLHIILSSRPDIKFKAWHNFIEISIEHLSKEQAINLIKRLNYDQNIKEKFISKLESEFYDLHTSFVSNPLLLTMMLLTFEEFAEIPNRIHLFYEHAFRTLYHRHDALKSSFKRDSKTKLDISEFSKIFSFFSLQTHLKKIHNLSESDIINFINNSLAYFNRNDIPPINFLHDSMDNLCLIQRDGLNFIFTHRSFQEYFCALYLLSCQSERIYDIFNQVAIANDNKIINILYDMNQSMVEKLWIKPKIEEMLSVNINSIEEKKEILQKIINIMIFRKSLITPGRYYLAYSPKSSLEGYNRDGFYRNLWEMFFDKIPFSNKQSHYFKDGVILLSHNDISKLFDRFNIFENSNDFIIKYESLNSLPGSIADRVINYLFDEIVDSIKPTLEKILHFINEKQSKNKFDIDELLK